MKLSYLQNHVQDDVLARYILLFWCHAMRPARHKGCASMISGVLLCIFSGPSPAAQILSQRARSLKAGLDAIRSHPCMLES